MSLTAEPYRSAPELNQLGSEVIGTREEVLACLTLQQAARKLGVTEQARRDSDTVVSLSLERIEESPRSSKALKKLDATGKSHATAAMPSPLSRGPPPLPPPLPKGWRQAVSKQGEVYFWNFWTREATYERPGARCAAAPTLTLLRVRSRITRGPDY